MEEMRITDFIRRFTRLTGRLVAAPAGLNGQRENQKGFAGAESFVLVGDRSSQDAAVKGGLAKRDGRI